MMPDSKASDYLKKFVKMLDDDKKVREMLARLVSHDCACNKAEEYVVCASIFKNFPNIRQEKNNFVFH